MALSKIQGASSKNQYLGQTYPPRLGYCGGEASSWITLLTNYFRIDVNPEARIHKYNVKIDGLPVPDPDITKERYDGGNQILGKTDGRNNSHEQEIPAMTDHLKSMDVDYTRKGGERIQKDKQQQRITGSQTKSDGGGKPDEANQLTLNESQVEDADDTDRKEKPKEGLIHKRKRMFEILLNDNYFSGAGSAIATDYAGTILTAEKLPSNEKVLELVHCYAGDDLEKSKAKPTNATVTYDKEIRLQDLLDYLKGPYEINSNLPKPETLQALNIIMRQVPSTKSNVFTSGDRSKFYTALGERCELSPCLVARKGFFASVRTSTSSLLLNLNVSTSAFYQEGWVNLAINAFRTKDNPNYDEAAKFLNKRRVSTNYRGFKKFKIIRGFAQKPGTPGFLNAHQAKFDFMGQETSVADYFQKEHGHTVKYPELPVLDLGKIVFSTSQDTESQSKDTEDSSQGIIEQSQSYKTQSKGLKVHSKDSKNHSKPQNPLNVTNAVHSESSGKASSAQDSNTPAPRLWVPAELCYILPGQAYGKKLNVRETEEMLDFAQKSPAQNAKRIVHAARDIMDLFPQNPCLRGFGLSVPPVLLAVNGRKLTTPKLSYDSRRKPYIEVGRWNMRGLKFIETKPLSNWTYLSLFKGEPDNDTKTRISSAHITEFTEKLRATGINVPERATLPGRDGKPQDGLTAILPLQGNDLDRSGTDSVLESSLTNAANANVKFLLVLLPCNDAYLYSRIKTLAETVIGIHTICVQVSKLDRPRKPNKKDPQSHNTRQYLLDAGYVGNVALKFNLKLGGINHKVSDGMANRVLKNTMIIGIDVNHPAQGAIKGAQSVAGVVANKSDGDLGQWPCSLQTQEGGQEIIKRNLKQMVKERLELWRRVNNGDLPARLLVYRDGVSEGQYQDVIKFELGQIREAYKGFQAKNSQEGKIAIVVVTKR